MLMDSRPPEGAEKAALGKATFQADLPGRPLSTTSISSKIPAMKISPALAKAMVKSGPRYEP